MLSLSSAGRSIHHQCLLARAMREGRLPHLFPGLAACQAPTSPPLPWGSTRCNPKRATNQARGQLCSAFLSCGQVVREGAIPSLPGNGWVPSQVVGPRHVPLSSPLPHWAIPTLKQALPTPEGESTALYLEDTTHRRSALWESESQEGMPDFSYPLCSTVLGSLPPSCDTA